MNKKKEEKLNPTPHLGIPRSNRQIFTFSENKLLDQITIEITEAWAKDLAVIRECQKTTKAAVKDFQNVTKLLEYKFESLNKFIGEDEFLPNMREIIEKQKTMFQFMEEIRQSCFKNEEQILGLKNYLLDTIDKIKQMPKVKDNPKKWWQFWK